MIEKPKFKAEVKVPTYQEPEYEELTFIAPKVEKPKIKKEVKVPVY